MLTIAKPPLRIQKGIWSEICLRLRANFGIRNIKTYHPESGLIYQLNTSFKNIAQSKEKAFPLFYKYFKCLKPQDKHQEHQETQEPELQKTQEQSPQKTQESQNPQELSEPKEPKRPKGSQIITYIDYERFEICEIVAYSLVCEFKDELLALEEKEIQNEKKKNQPSTNQNQDNNLSIEVVRRNKIYKEKENALINLFFDNLKESVESLLKQTKESSPLDPYQENLLKWQLTINIRRRFIQIMSFYEQKHDFSNKIFQSYESIARKLVNYFQYKTLKTEPGSEEFNNSVFPTVEDALALIEKMSPQNKITDNKLLHPLVGDEFRALFSTNINQQIWSPYANAQKRFQESNSSTIFGQQPTKDMSETYQHQDKNFVYSSLSFIPTSVTQMIFFRILKGPGKIHVICGFKTFGKSMNFVLFATLNNYLKKNHIVLFPNIMNMKPQLIAQIFFEAYWRMMNKEEMSEWMNLVANKLNKKELNISQKVIECFEFFKKKKPMGTIIFDQFSTYVGVLYKKQQLQTNPTQQYHQIQSLIKYLKQNIDQKIIFGSSISYELISLKKALLIQTIQDISVLNIDKFFTKQQATYIIKVWLQKIDQIKLNLGLPLIEETSENIHQEGNKAEENIKELSSERLSFTKKIIDFYFSWENKHGKNNSDIFLVGSISLLKSFSEHLYTQFFLSKSEVKYLQQINYTYDQSDLAKNVRDKLLEFMKENLSKWYIKQIKEWILKEQNTEMANSRRIIVSEIFLFNQFYIERYAQIQKSQFKSSQKEKSINKEQIVLPYFLIKKNTYTIYEHLIPFIPQIYNSLKSQVDPRTKLTYIIKACKTFIDFMSATNYSFSAALTGGLLHHVFNMSMEFSQTLPNLPGFGKKYPSLLNFIQAIKFSKQESKNLRLKCPVRLFKMVSTYNVALELNENNQLIEGNKTKNQFVKEINRYICRAVQECEEKSVDLSEHPLYVYVMPAQSQASCDGLLVEVQKVQGHYNLRILMIELGVNKLSKGDKVKQLGLNNLAYFHFFKEGFQNNEKKFKISSRNLALITSSKISYQIAVSEKIPSDYLKITDIHKLSVNASPPPQLPTWHEIIWDDIKLNEKEQLLLYGWSKLTANEKKILQEKSKKLEAGITLVDVRLIDQLKDIEDAYWTYRNLSPTAESNLLKKFEEKKESQFKKFEIKYRRSHLTRHLQNGKNGKNGKN